VGTPVPSMSTSRTSRGSLPVEIAEDWEIVHVSGFAPLTSTPVPGVRQAIRESARFWRLTRGSHHWRRRGLVSLIRPPFAGIEQLPTQDHQLDRSGIADVLQGIRGKHDKIRQLSRLDRADVFFGAQRDGSIMRCRA